MIAGLPGRGGSPLLFAFRMAPRKRKYIGQVNPNCKGQAPINEAIKDKIQVKNKCEVGSLNSYHSCVRGVSTGYGLDGRVWIRGRGKIFLFPTTRRPVLGPTQPPIQ
jgi:hypothetical protein